MDKRILLVEENKSLSSLIAKKISSTLGFEVDVAYTFQEAKLFVAAKSYFIALLDLNLSDAPNAEVVDFMISKNIKSIVLSGSEDKELKKTILNKDIIDYVNKGGVEDINYIIHTIERLYKNQDHKVMVVDDSVVFRNLMKKMLTNMFFKVYPVAHGEEALLTLEQNPDIKIVLTDYNMPVMNGLELTREIRKTHSKQDLSIFVISNSEDSEISAKFLKSGANDYIKKPFSKEEFSCRINNAIEALENIDKIINNSKRDYLTGLYNRSYFYKNANEYFSTLDVDTDNLSIAMIDIDDFKSIHDKYGHEIADRVIIEVANILNSNTSENDLVARFGNESFCLLFKNVSHDEAYEICDRIRQKVQSSQISFDNGFSLSISTGLYSQLDQSITNMVNEADMLLYNAKNSGKNCICV